MKRLFCVCSIAVFCFSTKQVRCTRKHFPHLYFAQIFWWLEVFAAVLFSAFWQRAKTQQVHFLMYSPPDRANVELERRAKLEGIQINSSAWEGCALHFLQVWPADHQLWTADLLDLIIFTSPDFSERKNRLLSHSTSFFLFFYGLTLARERSHLVTFSAVYWTTNEHPEMVFVGKK